MQRILYLFVLVFNLFASNAQSIHTDSVPSHDITSHPVDTTQVGNSDAVNLILQSQTENFNNSIKEDFLNEQLKTLEHDLNQRKIVQQQLDELRKADSIRKVFQQNRIDSLKRNISGNPVVLGQDTVCLIYTNLGPFNPDERAKRNSEKLLRAAKMFSMKNDSLFITESGTTSDIMYNETILMSITDTDALWMSTSRESLATKYKQNIYTSIEKYKKGVSFLNILKLIGLSLLVILFQYGLLKGVNYLFRKVIDKEIEERKDKWFKGIKIRTLEVLNPEKQLAIIKFISKVVRYALYAILFYLTLPILFSIFPMTQKLAETLFSWIFNPISSIIKSFIDYLPDLLKTIITIVIMRYIVRFVQYVMTEIECGRLEVPGFYPDWAKATFNILRIFLYAFMLVIIFPYLPGSDSGVFKGVSVFIGIIFSLGSSSVISNMVAGMVITYMRSFVIGDRIKIGEVFGDVIEKSPFVIRVKTHKNEIISIPNSSVLSSNVVNYSSSALAEGLILHTTITQGYDVPWQQVNELLIKAALKTDLVLHQPAPFVLHTALNDFSASYQLCIYTNKPEKQAGIYSQLHKNIMDCFHEAGLELNTPTYNVNELIIPKQEPMPPTQKQTT